MESMRRSSGEASFLLEVINRLADSKGNVSIDLLNSYVPGGQLMETLEEMETAKIINLDRGTGTVSVLRPGA